MATTFWLMRFGKQWFALWSVRKWVPSLQGWTRPCGGQQCLTRLVLQNCMPFTIGGVTWMPRRKHSSTWNLYPHCHTSKSFWGMLIEIRSWRVNRNLAAWITGIQTAMIISFLLKEAKYRYHMRVPVLLYTCTECGIWLENRFYFVWSRIYAYDTEETYGLWALAYSECHSVVRYA